MQLKRFSAPSSSAVLAQIKAELGPDAIILDRQEENGMVTMTAALERPKSSVSFAAARTESASAQEAAMPAGWQEWREEWLEIKDHLLALMKPALGLDKLPARQRLAVEFLQREGVSDEVLPALVRELRAKPDMSILTPLGGIVRTRAWGVQNWPQRLHIFTGPFGAGKTTVAIRMALALRQESPSLRICMINADATRGNGRLLLRHYSDLSDFAYKEASSTLELAKAVAEAEREGFDRVIADLPGLGRNTFLSALLEDAGLAENDAATHLTLAPHYAERELTAQAARYKTRLPGSVVWTKLDETERFGCMVNVAFGTALPISALSYGPGLGNSLVPAREALVWKVLFKRELP